jgi:hypothetical protein
MGAAHPVNEEHNLAGSGIDIRNQLLDHGADNALLEPRVSSWGAPDRAQIVGYGCQRRRVQGWGCHGVVFGDFCFYLSDAQERPVSTRLQFCRHQAVRGIGRVVLAECSVSGVASGFKITQ